MPTPVKPSAADPTNDQTNDEGKSTSNANPEGDVSERKPYKDVDGNQIDAPVIPSFEREVQEAQNRADETAIAEIHERYHKARDEKVKADNKREKDRRKDNS